MKTNTIVTGLGLALLLVSVNCSSKFGDYCDKQKSCEGGNDKDRDACVEQLSAQEDIAGDYDCGDQFDAVVDCQDKITCNNGHLDTSPCQAQLTALGACQTAASGNKNSIDVSSSGGSSSGATITIDAGP